MTVVTGSTPFDLGKTFYDGGTIDSNKYGGVELEGQTCTFVNTSVPASGTTLQTQLEGGPIVTRVVRNVSGIALLPGRLVIYKTDQINKRVDGYTSTTAQWAAGVVDPWLPAAGVPNGDLFHIVIYGTVPVRRALSDSAADDAVGDILYAITAATSQATTAGRFTRHVGTFTAAQTTDGTATNIETNFIGRAASACTTAGTNQLRNVRIRLDR